VETSWQIRLSNKQRLLFNLLDKNRGVTVGMKQIKNHIWKSDGVPDQRVYILVSRLRRKLPEYLEIATIQAQGFTLRYRDQR